MIGILLMTHAPLGEALLAVATHVYKQSPTALVVIDVQSDEDTEMLERRAHAAIAALDDGGAGSGVLMFTDICGATPANCAVRVLNQAQTNHGNAPLDRLGLIYGVSLPTLLRTLCYRANTPLTQLIPKIIEGGQRGLFAHQTNQDNRCPTC